MIWTVIMLTARVSTPPRRNRVNALFMKHTKGLRHGNVDVKNGVSNTVETVGSYHPATL